MDANDTQQQDITPAPRKLLRSREDRLIGGVCGGLGRYFNVDPILFRIGIAVLALRRRRRHAPLPGRPPAGAERAGRAGRRPAGGDRSVLVVVGVVALLVVAWPFLSAAASSLQPFSSPSRPSAIAGVLVWWLVSGEGPTGEPRTSRCEQRSGLGILILPWRPRARRAVAAAAGGSTIVA